MLRIIEKIRTEQEAYRRRVTVLASAGFTGVIFLAWLAYITSGPLNYAQESAVASSTSPVVALKKMTNEAVSSVKDLAKTLSEFKEAVQSMAVSSSTEDGTGPDKSEGLNN